MGLLVYAAERIPGITHVEVYTREQEKPVQRPMRLVTLDQGLGVRRGMVVSGKVRLAWLDEFSPMGETHAVDQRRPRELERPRQGQQVHQPDQWQRHVPLAQQRRHRPREEAVRQPLRQVQAPEQEQLLARGHAPRL